MGDTASGSGGGSVLQALSAAVDLDPRRVLLRRLRQLEAARQAELAIFDRMLEHLPLELVRRIVYMADALQRLDEFRGTPLAPDLLSQRLTDVCLASRAHRDAAAQTPCCVALPVLPLLRLHRLDSCLDWLARRRLADVTLASAGMAHSAVTALAAALDRHAPKLRLSSPRLALVAEEAGQVFDAGTLAAFSQLQALHLDQYAAAQLAELPPTTTGLAFYLPGRTHELQHAAHAGHAPYLLPAPPGLLRPLLSPPSHRLAQLAVKGALAGPAGPAATHVMVEAAKLFAAAAAISLEAHTLCLLVPPRQPQQRRRWLAALLAPAWALARCAGGAAGQRLGSLRRGSRAAGAGGEGYQPLATDDGPVEASLESGTCEQGRGGSGMVPCTSSPGNSRRGGRGSRQQQPRQELTPLEQQELLAALLDCFENSGCTSARLTATCMQLAPVEAAEAAEDGASSSGAAPALATPAASAMQAAPEAAGPTAAAACENGSSQGAGSATAVQGCASLEQPSPPRLRHAELRWLLAAQPRRRRVLTALLGDELLAEMGEGAAALGADGALLRVVLCRRSAARSVDSRPLVCDLPGLEARMRAPLRHAVITCLGLAACGWGLVYVLFFATGPAVWLVRGVLLCLVLLVADALRRRCREGRAVDVGRVMRTVGRRLRLAVF